MPRFDGEVFRFGTAIAVTPLCDLAVRNAAYRRSKARRLGHDPEKWVSVSPLREALQPLSLSYDASAGEGRSEKIIGEKIKFEANGARSGL
jgi:hypothetical protein